MNTNRASSEVPSAAELLRDRAFLSPNEVSRVTGVSPATVHRWLKAGTIPSKKVGAIRLIPTEAIRALAAA